MPELSKTSSDVQYLGERRIYPNERVELPCMGRRIGNHPLNPEAQSRVAAKKTVVLNFARRSRISEVTILSYMQLLQRLAMGIDTTLTSLVVALSLIACHCFRGHPWQQRIT